MKKKEYLKPETSVVDVDVEVSILAASGEMDEDDVQINDFYDEGEALSAGYWKLEE